MENKNSGLGIRIKLPLRPHGKIYSRSGLASQYDVELIGGTTVVAEDFIGPLCFWLRNHSSHPDKE